jgi:hypothetical protein
VDSSGQPGRRRLFIADSLVGGVLICVVLFPVSRGVPSGVSAVYHVYHATLYQ